jgi:ribonuclease P/MRP protein subunit RPP1
MIISEKTFEKARKTIREAKKPIIFTSDDDDLNRKILEKENIQILLITQKNRKDFSKQRDSGFNQVLAKLAKKNNITIGINLDEIIEAKSKEKSEILARIKQNIMLCKKNKLNMKFISQKHKKDNYDLKALGISLGMPTNMAAEAVQTQRRV